MGSQNIAEVLSFFQDSLYKLCGMLERPSRSLPECCERKFLSERKKVSGNWKRLSVARSAFLVFCVPVVYVNRSLLMFCLVIHILWALNSECGHYGQL